MEQSLGREGTVLLHQPLFFYASSIEDMHRSREQVRSAAQQVARCQRNGLEIPARGIAGIRDFVVGRDRFSAFIHLPNVRHNSCVTLRQDEMVLTDESGADAFVHLPPTKWWEAIGSVGIGLNLLKLKGEWKGDAMLFVTYSSPSINNPEGDNRYLLYAFGGQIGGQYKERLPEMARMLYERGVGVRV